MIQHTKALFEIPPATGGDLLLLHYLAYRADASGSCYPGMERIARECAMTERGVQKALVRLKQLGVVTVSYRMGRNNVNVYQLHLKTPQNVHPEDGGETPNMADKPRTTFTPNIVHPEHGDIETPNIETETPNIETLNPEQCSPKTPRNILETPRETPSSSRGKRELGVHNLFDQVRAKINAAYLTKNEVKAPWDAAEGAQLSKLLNSMPDAPLEFWSECLDGWMDSENVSHSEFPRYWIPRLANFKGGLDRYNRPFEDPLLPPKIIYSTPPEDHIFEPKFIDIDSIYSDNPKHYKRGGQ